MARRAGLVLCCLCFEAKPREEMWTDDAGDTWDVCKPCHVIEEELIARKHTWPETLADDPG